MYTHTHTHTHTHSEMLTSHKKMNILPFASTWMDLEDIVLSEISKRKKYCVILLIGGI